MTATWLVERERLLFFIVTGLAEGVLTALILAAGRMLEPSHSLTAGLALRIGMAAGFPEAVVFFAAEYARQRGQLLRMERQLNLTERGRLVSSRLGRQALGEASGAAILSGVCAFAGASIPLVFASVLPGPGWLTIVIAVGCLGLLGAGIGHTTQSCKPCWSLALGVAGGVLATLGYFLHVV